MLSGKKVYIFFPAICGHVLSLVLQSKETADLCGAMAIENVHIIYICRLKTALLPRIKHE